MKQILLLTLLLSQIFAHAQYTFSCTAREYCYWDSLNQIYTDCEGYSEYSLFVINEELTFFTHITETKKSTYFITEKKFDKKEEALYLRVISDVGNKYFYVFNYGKENIYAHFKKNGGSVLLSFKVKSIL